MVKYVGPLSSFLLKKSSVISVRFSYNGAVLRLKPQKLRQLHDDMHVVLDAGSAWFSGGTSVGTSICL